MSLYARYGKRAIDIVCSVLALIILSPILILVAAMLFFSYGCRSPFFLQRRPGRHAKIFKIVKFKTMSDRRGADGELLPDEQRLTRLGRFVRSTSLDELPQLVNVLVGDMSLIGPRPLLPKYLPLYSERQARRHEVRPGITGWAQCHGRNAISWGQKFELDVWYVDHISLKTDLSIVWTTAKKVLSRADISSATSATMEAFDGHN